MNQKRSDVRVLIDISGSMKKNDPKNLRIPALKIITNLMPKGSESGVWAFGKFVNMLVPIKEVDEKWQSDANKAADKISSAGLFTNIGDAMAKSSWDWTRPDPSEKRSMILLTDGMVDVSKDPKVNEQERQRILNTILPKLKNAGVTIHTIALSQDADQELLSTLANETDGWFTAVNDAEGLQRIFLKIFEQATPRDNLPLTDNQFKVDNSVEEMTLLVFREEGSSATVLVSPSDQRLTQETSDKNLRWYASSAYDLITVNQPEVGDWRIDAAIDPDNRVMVVSKLGLMVDELANNVLAREQIKYRIQLLEDGKAITRSEFLNLVDANLNTTYNGKDGITPLLRNDSTGEFQQIFYSGEKDGLLEITLTVKSPTFERSRRHAINVYGQPIQSDLQVSMIDGGDHTVYLRAAEDVLDLSSLKVNVKILFPDETSQYTTIDNFTDDTQFTIEGKQKGAYQVSIKVSGNSKVGRAFSTDLPLIEFSTAEETIEPEEVIPVEDTPEEVPVEPEPEPEPDVEETKEPEPEVLVLQPEQEPTNWVLWLSIGLGANILVIIGGWLTWRLVKKRTQSSTDDLTQDLFSEDTAE